MELQLKLAEQEKRIYCYITVKVKGLDRTMLDLGAQASSKILSVQARSVLSSVAVYSQASFPQVMARPWVSILPV